MSATAGSFNNNRSEEEQTYSSNFFESIINGLANLCSCSGEWSSSSSSCGDTQHERNEQCREINIGEEFARNLTETFSDSSSNLPTGFQPVITIPVALGRQLYEAYVESLHRQQKAQNQILADLIEEDKEFARHQLPEEEERNAQEPAVPRPTSSAASTGILAEREQKRKKQEDFPVVNQAKDTFDLKLLSGVQDDENDHPPKFYRDLAEQHSRRRNHFYQEAKKCKKAKNIRLAHFYFQQAREQTKLRERANNSAAAAILAENNENTIDLHHLFVKEAIVALDSFLDNEILSLQNQNLQKRSVRVVTGQGKHSANGIPRVKLAVIERLEQRNLKYSESEINPGVFKVHIFKQSQSKQ